MKCPKCQGVLETIIHSHIEAQGCINCRGLLLKPQVVEEVMLYEMLETVLDIGAPALGEKYDKIADIVCPHCQLHMKKREDPVQTHIWTEQCPGCNRIFFDAGELTDLKFETVADIFRDMLKGHREED